MLQRLDTVEASTDDDSLMTMVKNQVATILFSKGDAKGQSNASLPKRSRQEQPTSSNLSDDDAELQDLEERPWNPVKSETGMTSNSNSYMTQDDYNDLHSGERLEGIKHTIAMFTANETVAKDALARVTRGRFHCDAFIAAINREHQNLQCGGGCPSIVTRKLREPEINDRNIKIVST